MHTAVQKYKAKTYEKVLTERMDTLTRDTQAFQDTVRGKLVDINALIDQKCKKAVAAVYESKIAKLEFDVKELFACSGENVNSGNKLAIKKVVKQAQSSCGSYSAKLEVTQVKKSVTEAIDKIKAENSHLGR